NGQALDVVLKKAEWVKLRVDRLSDEQQQAALETEFGGMNEVLANLYAVTGDPEHLRVAKKFDHRAVFDPLARGEDSLNGLHANTQIPKAIGAAREYELTGEKRYHDIASFFWQRVAKHRSYVIGGHSDGEHFFPVENFSKYLGASTTETCNTYNVPLRPGAFKTFSTPEESFWCCVGTGMENHAKYPDTIYFHDAQSLYVNLFVASELTWKGKGLVVRQETRFPEEDATRLVLKL